MSEAAPAGWYRSPTGRVWAAEEVEVLRDADGRRFWRPIVAGRAEERGEAPPAEKPRDE